MDIEKSIVHILDSEQNTFVASLHCMKDLQPEVLKMIESKASKVIASRQKKNAEFKQGGLVKGWIETYKNQMVSFEEMSEKIAHHLFDQKMKYGVYEGSDFIVSIVIIEGRRYLFLLDNGYQHGMTHFLTQEEGIQNEIIPYRTLLAPNLSKKDRAAFIELSDNSILCVENKVDIEAEKVNFFSELVLECTTKASYQEAVKTMMQTAKKMQEKYDVEEVELLPKIKSAVNECVENQQKINVREIADILFTDKPLIRDDFAHEVQLQVSDEIDVEHVKPVRSEKVQKIKTDNGIELIIPLDYMNSKDYVEFVTQSDGTISIQLKNIGHISSK